jgi:hypothetical protein
MAEYLIKDSTLTEIADAVRNKTGKTGSLSPDQMASDLNAIANRTSSDLTVNGATITAPAGYYASQATKSVSTGSAKTPATTITKNPTISVDSSGKITASVSGTQNVTPTVTAGYVSSGTAGTITVSGSATSQLTTQAAKTVTPSKSSQTAVASGVYTTGAVTVGAIPSEYITTTDATASADEIFSGETAYVNGNKVTGTFTIDSELSTQDSLITQIQNAVNSLPDAGSGSEDLDAELTTQENLITELSTILDNKASGGSSGGSVETYAVTISDPYEIFTFYYTDENMEPQTGTGTRNITVLKNTIIICISNASTFSVLCQGSYNTVYNNTQRILGIVVTGELLISAAQVSGGAD